jgi:uncharacterized membrane protein YfcA
VLEEDRLARSMLELIRDAVDADVLIGLTLAATVAGLVRGFSGFGSAMVFIPIASALTDPPTAVILLFVVDELLTVPMVVAATRHCAWREVLPLGLGAALTAPFGVWLLVVMDPTAMRWVISTLILVLVGVLATGWRWSRPPSLPSTVAVGGASGLTGGMTGIGGPPVILFWLAGHDGPRVLRANIIVFLTFVGLFNVVGYVVGDLMTGERIALGLALIPAYGVALLLGVWLFRFATARFFRRLAFGLCAVAALTSLPLFDGLL